MTTERVRQYRKKRAIVIQRYSDMKCRTLGKYSGDGKTSPWKGLSLCEKDDFINWSLTDLDFNRLFDNWVKSGYTRRTSPSIHRLDSTKGYDLDNIKWVTHLENSHEALARGKQTRERNRNAGKDSIEEA